MCEKKLNTKIKKCMIQERDHAALLFGQSKLWSWCFVWFLNL